MGRIISIDIEILAIILLTSFWTIYGVNLYKINNNLLIVLALISIAMTFLSNKMCTGLCSAIPKFYIIFSFIGMTVYNLTKLS